MRPFPSPSRPIRLPVDHVAGMPVQMITSLGGVLRLVLHHADPAGPQAPDLPGEQELPEVEFSAYAEDCRVSGLVRLDAGRLTDMLNDHTELELVDVVVESLADGSTSRLPGFTVQRDELLVVEATGPRGDPGRRTRVQPNPLAAKLGPYELRGFVHLPHRANTLDAVRRRRPMVPMTSASIAYEVAGVPVLLADRTLIFNRECTDWLRVIDRELIESPERPFPTLELPLPPLSRPQAQLTPSTVRHG